MGMSGQVTPTSTSTPACQRSKQQDLREFISSSCHIYKREMKRVRSSLFLLLCREVLEKEERTHFHGGLAGGLIGASLLSIDRQDDVAGLLLRFDVPGRLDHVLQRVAPIDDRPVSPGLDELLEEEDVLLRVSRWYREDHFLVSDPRGPQRQDEILEPVGCQVAAAPLQ